MQDACSEEVKPVLYHVRVGLPGGTVHHMEVSPDALLTVVIDMILEKERLNPANTRIRLITAGKVHPDNNVPLKEVVSDGGFIHCSISNLEPNTVSNAAQPSAEIISSRETRLPIAHNVSGEISIIIPDLNSQAAFNELSRAGFSADEIRMIRRHAHALRRETRNQIRLDSIETMTHIDSVDNSRPLPVRDQDEIPNVTTRAHHHNNILSSAVEGTSRDFLMGCVLGYLLGILILVVLMDSRATNRWRIGIIAGVATNCAFGVLRTSVYVHDFIAT